MQVLEGMGLVSIGDLKRSRPIQLTDEGYALHDRIVAVSLAREKLMLDGFSPNEKTIVLGYLARMFNNMELANAIDPLKSSERSARQHDNRLDIGCYINQ
jgi:hypothetical protein